MFNLIFLGKNIKYTFDFLYINVKYNYILIRGEYIVIYISRKDTKGAYRF